MIQLPVPSGEAGELDTNSSTHKQRSSSRWNKVSAQSVSDKSMSKKHNVQPIFQSPQECIFPSIVVLLILTRISGALLPLVLCSRLSLTTSSVSMWSYRWLDNWIWSTCVYCSTSSFLPLSLQARPWNQPLLSTAPYSVWPVTFWVSR